MTEPPSRAFQLFLELFTGLPRQGPGNRASAARALALCRGLAPRPLVLDVGCGAGGQTLHLAGLIAGVIVAFDTHRPAVARLRDAVSAHHLSSRVLAVIGDMSAPPVLPGGVDLAWSEGALYNMGIANALATYAPVVRPGGYLAFTDAVWRRPDPPADVRAAFDLDYPAMGFAADVAALIADSPFALVDHFTLPDDAWWNDFYTPMLARLADMRRHYAGDEEALAVLATLEAEPEMHRRHGDCYGYEFFVARRRG